MELYIEKEFLDNFYYDTYEEVHLSNEEKIVKSMLSEYGDKSVFMNYEMSDFKELEKLKTDNEYFALLCAGDKSPIEVEDIEKQLFKSDFNQTIVFMNKKEEWFEEAENKGALCFSFENYKEKIKEIVEKVHFRIDLSESFQGWDILKSYQHLSFNTLTFNDSYIVTDKTNQKIDKNLVPILKNIIFDKAGNKIKVNILTTDLNALSSSYNHEKEKCKKVYNKLNREFANFKSKFEILLKSPYSFDFHDRMILTNFSILECPKGFNLIPFKTSSSQILSESIFTKYVYNRHKNIRKAHKEYIKNVKSMDTTKFKMYPES